MLNVFTNKHVIVAMIVSPILAVLAYYAVDYKVSEKPHSAVSGKSYPLVAQSNCRYSSGKCTFKNGDIEVSISLSGNKTNGNNQQWTLVLDSQLPLQGAKVALIDTSSAAASPQGMSAQNNEMTQWQTNMDHQFTEDSTLQLAIAIDDTFYYGETSTLFTHYAVGFPQPKN
jgi:hypothetical protein